MFRDEFKERYTTIPFAVYRARYKGATTATVTHYHRETELISMTAGAAEFYINSERCCAKKGDLLVIPPYALHRGYTVGDEPCSYDCICFDSGLLCDESLKNGLESQSLTVIPLVSGELPYGELIREYIEKAMLACEKKDAGWELEAVGNISMLFAILKKNRFIVQDRNDTGDIIFGRKVMDYLAKNVSAQITSRDAARELYMNQSYFCRLFKKTFGCTFEKYVLIYRLEKARLLLANTSLPVTDIAFSLGFCNCSYFGKVFKERFNVTPTSYRRSTTDAN